MFAYGTMLTTMAHADPHGRELMEAVLLAAPWEPNVNVAVAYLDLRAGNFDRAEQLIRRAMAIAHSNSIAGMLQLTINEIEDARVAHALAVQKQAQQSATSQGKHSAARLTKHSRKSNRRSTTEIAQ